MSIFQKRLVRALRERLENREYRYVDNSFACYSNPIPENMEADKRWFAENSIPSAGEFLQMASAAILEQVRYKSRLYDMLGDRHSRDMLLMVALYALLGHRFVKFPYYGPQTLHLRKSLHQRHLVADAAPIPACESGLSYPLNQYRFVLSGEELCCYTTAEFVYQAIHASQYHYARGGTIVDVREGDRVLDCGACTGDTALYFAGKAGSNGRVVSFEPHPGLAKVWERNRQLNPSLASRMHLMPVATSRECGSTVFSLSGPGSHMGGGNARLQQVKVPQMTLDAAVEGLGMDRVDLIKMDVEGAELATLQGAEGLLRRFRPKLAVCVYHKPQDYQEIPEFLESLDLGYRFYLEHHFVNEWETVLYAMN